MDYVHVQVQISGVWQTFRSLPNNSQMILCEMKNAKATYPDYRIRTVDANDRLIDMLP